MKDEIIFHHSSHWLEHFKHFYVLWCPCLKSTHQMWKFVHKQTNLATFFLIHGDIDVASNRVNLFKIFITLLRTFVSPRWNSNSTFPDHPHIFRRSFTQYFFSISFHTVLTIDVLWLFLNIIFSQERFSSFFFYPITSMLSEI